MSIGGIMRTSVSGMNAQANRLSAVSENIANANTTGYKRNTTEFSSMVLASGPGQFNSGVVETQTRQLISQQGGLSYTTNSSSSQAIDLAIQGSGFMVVGDGAGGSFLTRAGSFVKNGDGDMVNAAGFILQGYPLPIGDVNAVGNGFAGLENVNLNAATLRLTPTDRGILTVNLDRDAKTTAVTAPGTPTKNLENYIEGVLPSTNPSDRIPAYTSKESIVVYDNAGKEITLDIYMTKKTDGLRDANGALRPEPVPPAQHLGNEWEVVVYDRAKGSKTGAFAPFPYDGGGANKQLGAVMTLTFDQSGKMTVPNPAALTIPIPNGQALSLDLSNSTSLSAPYQTLATSVNGNPPENVDQIKVGADGTISAVFRSGTEIPLYKVPLAFVESPDNMTSLSGNVYSAGIESGTVLVDFGGEGGLGKLVAGALEQSTVDLASELTTMIESQRSYTANSKVFQTGSEILDVLVNLKR